MGTKKIAIIMSDMIVGGIEKELIAFLNVLDYEKYVVTVYLKDCSGVLTKQINSNVLVRYWENKRNNTREYIKQQFEEFRIIPLCLGIYNRLMARKYKASWELSSWYSGRCLPLLDEKKYDCVIAFNEGQIDVVANALYCIRATKKILWVHGKIDWPAQTLKHQEYEYSKFDCIYCVSPTVQKWFDETFPKLNQKTKVMHNLINENEILKMAEEDTDEVINSISILTVGRLRVEKGQDMIPQAARILLDRGYNFTWYLVGDGELRKDIEKEIEKYDVGGCVVLLGTKVNPYPYMKKCDIYVQTSLIEGWGLTVQEAKLLKKPIVITPDPALSEQIRHGENGVIAEEISPEAISESIIMLLERPELINKFCTTLQNEKYQNFEELELFYNFIDN